MHAIGSQKSPTHIRCLLSSPLQRMRLQLQTSRPAHFSSPHIPSLSFYLFFVSWGETCCVCGLSQRPCKLRLRGPLPDILYDPGEHGDPLHSKAPAERDHHRCQREPYQLIISAIAHTWYSMSLFRFITLSLVSSVLTLTLTHALFFSGPMLP